MPPPERPPKPPKTPKETLPSQRVMQLLPTPGWFAECLAEDGTAAMLPLVGWATTPDGEVVGLIARDRVEDCTEVPEFQRYWKEG